MRSLLLAVVIVVAAACSGEPDAPPATTSFLIFGPEETAAVPAVAVRRFEVQPDSVRAGQRATAAVVLDRAVPRRRVTVGWYGPDGWLAAYERVDMTRAAASVEAPAAVLAKPGRYRAVLSSGATDLAEDTLTVTE